MGGGKDTETTTISMTPEQQAASSRLVKKYGGQIGEYNAYQGDRLAPFSNLQQDVLSGVAEFQQNDIPLHSETGTATKGLLEGTIGGQRLGDADVSDYFNRVYRDPAMFSLKNEINPAIDESFAGPGFFGSARSNARVDAAQDTQRMLSEQRGAINWAALTQNQALDEARANRTLATLPAGMRFGTEELQVARQLFGFGQIEQSQEQRALEAEFARFLDKNRITDPETINILMTALGQQSVQQTNQEGNAQSMTSQDWSSILARSGAGALAGWAYGGPYGAAAGAGAATLT